MRASRNSRKRAAFQVPIYCHATDPIGPYKLALSLGRAVALELIDWDEALDCMMAVAIREAVKRKLEYDPRGLLTRMTWALSDFAQDTLDQSERLPGRMMQGIAARLRSLSSHINEAQADRAMAELEKMVLAIGEEAGRPYRAGELDGIVTEATRSALRRVARERGQ